jgi:hypothetical protein
MKLKFTNNRIEDFTFFVFFLSFFFFLCWVVFFVLFCFVLLHNTSSYTMMMVMKENKHAMYIYFDVFKLQHILVQYNIIG